MKALGVGLAILLTLTGCSGGEKSGETSQAQKATAETEKVPMKEPDRITVQHVLIAFAGSINKPSVTRTKEEAKAVAENILRRAQAGEDFGELVRQYSDDQFPGLYTMVNDSVAGADPPRVFDRHSMVPAFGDIGFALQIGEVGMAEYSPQTSPFGWHIIKRVE